MYGLRVSDISGNSALLTPKIGRLVSGGILTMPNTLNEDDTYGTDIDLPGTEGIPIGDLSVLTYPSHVHVRAIIESWSWAGNLFPFSWYAEDGVSYYTKDDETGVMTAWAAGARVTDDADTWDGMCNAFPLTGWDTPGDPATVTKVRIWAATAHIVHDASAGIFKTVYTIGDAGVEKVSYMITLKNH